MIIYKHSFLHYDPQFFFLKKAFAFDSKENL